MLYEIECMYSNKTKEEILAAYEAIDPSAVFQKENTTLHLAASFADSQAVALLLSKGANANATNKFGQTPLHYLAKLDGIRENVKEGEVRKCAELLLDAKASTFRKDTDIGETPLTEAAKWGRLELIQVAAEKGAKLTATNKNGDNPLHLLCEYARHALSSQKSAQSRVENLQPDDSNSRKADAHTELQNANALVSAYLLSVKTLLDAGFDADEKNNYGKSPLDIAIANGAKDIAALISGESGATGGMNIFQGIEKEDYETIKTLIDSGVDLNSLNDAKGDYNGLTPLGMACLLLNEKAVKIFLEAGADPHFKNSSGRIAIAEWFKYRGDSGFSFKAMENKTVQSIIKLFKEYKLDFNSFIDDKSNTLLTAACAKADQGAGYNTTRFYALVIQTLLKMNCDVNISNLDGQTPLMFICSLDDSCISNLQLTLLEQGAEVDVADKAGNTPLHYCASNPNANLAKELAENLFEFGSPNPNAANNDAKTPLEIASDKNNEPLVKFLLMNS